MPALKHFENPRQVAQYALEEVLDSLYATLNRMCREEYSLYTDEDRRTLEKKINDVEACAPIIVKAMEGVR